MDLGKYIEKKRLAVGLSQRELAKKTHGLVGWMAINHIEKGDTKNPGIGTLIPIAKALNIPIGDLILAYEGKDPDTADTSIANPEIQEFFRSIIRQVPTEILLEILKEQQQ